MTSIGVTGATGRLGSRIASRLSAAGVEQRLIVRDRSRAPLLPGATTATASYSDGVAVEAALAGLSVVLMVSAAEALDRRAQQFAFVDAAARAGVEHIVYTSFCAASADSTFTLGRDHWATEEHIRASGLQFTFLRDNFYADILPSYAGADGAIRGPAADGRIAVVAMDDVADVASAILLDASTHAGETYTMTGPESLTLTEVAAIITAELGRPVRYVPETMAEAYASRAKYGAADWQVEAWVSTYTAIANGEVAAISEDVPRIAGHPATSLAELLRSGRSAY